MKLWKYQIRFIFVTLVQNLVKIGILNIAIKKDIEYIRTDVSIKKALKWMISQGGVDDALSRQMIEDFKNYMKIK